MMTQAYGAPGWMEPSQTAPYVPPTTPVPFVSPFTVQPPGRQVTPEDWADFFLKIKSLSPAEATTRRLRVAARKTDEGIAVKVYLDGKLLCETTVDGLAASIDLDI